MSSSIGFELGHVEGEQVQVQVISRAYPGGLGIFDDNWLNVQIHARVSPKSFRFGAFLRARSFAVFAQELQGLAAGDCARALFESRDPWLWVELRRGDAGDSAAAETMQETLEERTWTFAKTMPENPHYWTAKDSWPDPQLFERVVEYIRAYGEQEIYEGRPYTVFRASGWKYWTMGSPVPETTIINRKRSTKDAPRGAFEASAAVRDGGSERAATIAWSLQDEDVDRLRAAVSAVVAEFGEIPGSER